MEHNLYDGQFADNDLLIVDDALANLRILSGMLKKHGYSVRSAPNGQTAIMIAENEPPDLILLDIVMPDMDGYEVCRHLKTDPTTSNIPIIFLSGRADIIDKVRGFESGGVDYITKPFQAEEVLARVRTHLNLRRLQRQLQERNQQLEHANTRLREHTAELEATNQELRSFAYVISHDLKAPLRGISRIAQWLVDDYDSMIDEQGKHMTKLLINRVKRMDSLIEGILEYSRIGRTPENTEDLDLKSLVYDMVAMLSFTENIHIVVSGEFPVITGNRFRISQVFQNLLDNAIKFMDKAEGEIQFSGRDDGTQWIFCVADNGPGIDKKYYEKIFQIFQTLNRRDMLESTGVGLAIVKKIIESYGGKIWIESQVGKGSQFYFTLPKQHVGDV